jgi:multidrug resistance efflux pump
VLTYLIGGFLAGMASTVIGGSVALAGRRNDESDRLAALEQVVPELISRAEVHQAFAQMAQAEAQRIAYQQRQVAQSERLQQRTAEVFGGQGNVDQQMAALAQQLAALNGQLGG